MTHPHTTSSGLECRIEEQLACLRSEGLYRQLVPGSSHLVNLASNDYLGLANQQSFATKCREAIAQLPPGCAASRLVSGEHPIYSEIESKLSDLLGCETSLFFSSGYAANEALSCLLALDSVQVFCDKKIHASMVDACRLTGSLKGKCRFFAHQNLGSLESMLKASLASDKVIMVEALYSMDGTFADLTKLAHLARTYGATLVIDEAHSFGVYGSRGRGLVHEHNLNPGDCIRIVTCGKALGVGGGFVAGPKWLRQWLINKARSFIYSTGPSPWLAASVGIALEQITEMDNERRHLKALSLHLQRHLEKLGIAHNQSASHIAPILTRDALTISADLRAKGYLCPAIRPPTVPKGGERLRVSLRADLSAEIIDTFLDHLRLWKQRQSERTPPPSLSHKALWHL